MATAAGRVPTPVTVITDEERRWVVIGICLNKLLTPALRTVLGQQIPIWYNNLCLLSNPINKQTYKKHATKLPRSTVKLNYGNINKNYDNHKSTYSAYDYDVKYPESLAKLFVQPFMAKFTGFDQTMDLSAALTLIAEADPFHSSGAAAQANIVRSNVRNEWAHCDFSQWNMTNYHTCIQRIESLVKKLNLSIADENDFVNELNNWKDKGVQLCCGQAVDAELLKLVETEVCQLNDSVQLWREESHKAQSRIVEYLQSAIQCFNAERQSLLQIQSIMGKDIESLKMKHQTLTTKYQTTSQQLEVLEMQVAKLSIESQEDIRPLFMLPDRADWFSGRKFELNNIHTFFQISQENNTPKVSIASVCGLGGNGKTSLAAEYAHRQKDFYKGGVFWLSGEDEEKFANSVYELAVYFGTLLEGSAGRTLVKTLDLISKIETPWLLVLDDMDEFRLSSNIEMLLSGPWKRRVRGSGNILITTRRKPKVMSETIRGFKESQCLQLRCFDLDDGKEFIFKRTGLYCDEKASSEATSLVATLGGLPLALEQACAYIRNLPCSLSDYLEQYEKCSSELLDQQDASCASLNQSSERLAVSKTWLLNFEYIRQSKKGNLAVRFLHACAFFNPMEIQQELINPGKPPIDDETYRDYVDTPLGSSHIQKLLTDFSLFQRNKGSSLSVHRLVQEVIKKKLRLENQKILSLVDAICMLSFAFSKFPSPDDLLLSNINTEYFRASTFAINPSLFHSWKRLCLHAREILPIINSLKVMHKEILIPETAKIVYQCALDFNVSSKIDRATRCVDFAHKIVNLGSTKCDLAAMFRHQVPLPESVRRYILYSCVSPLGPPDSSSLDNRAESKCKMEQMHAEGNSHFSNGNFHKAVEMYSSAMTEVSSFDRKLLCDRALAYINLRQNKSALADLENYLYTHSKCWVGLALKALALHGLNEIWEASSFAALAFYYNRDIFLDHKPFGSTFSTLKDRILICDDSLPLANSLLKPHTDFRVDVEWPSRIVMIEPGNYLVNASLVLPIDDCILLGIGNSKSSVVVRFNELITVSARRILCVNLSFVFTSGWWHSMFDSITTWLNCSFTSSMEEGEYTFLCQGTDTFRGCSFQNSKSPCLTVMGGANVEKCVFSGGEYSGVHVNRKGNLEIKESKIYGNKTGIYIAQGLIACNITNCDIFDNKTHGINVEKYVSNVRVDSCRIYQNDRNGIYVVECASASVCNSEIFENGWMGIATILNASCVISHNRIYRNKSGGVQVVPVEQRKGLSHSIVEFNEIFENHGFGLYCEMMFEDTPVDTSVSVSKNAMKQYVHYIKNQEIFKRAQCNENKCYNNDDDTITKKYEVSDDFCSYCRRKCSLNCAKCLVTGYCNLECQSRDWKKHKSECPSILKTSAVFVSIPPKKRYINLEHFPFVNYSNPQQPGLASKGSQFKCPQNSKGRFLVKVLAADKTWHSNSVGPLFTICDRSLTINGILDKTCYPRLYNIVLECGVSSTVVEGWKKKFFWARYHTKDCQKLIVYLVKLPQNEDW